MPVIPELGKQRQKDGEQDTQRPCLKISKKFKTAHLLVILLLKFHGGKLKIQNKDLGKTTTVDKLASIISQFKIQTYPQRPN
jgi:hypothetical protein